MHMGMHSDGDVTHAQSLAKLVSFLASRSVILHISTYVIISRAYALNERGNHAGVHHCTTQLSKIHGCKVVCAAAGIVSASAL